MNEMREKLSALMDGSLKRSEAEEVLQTLEQEPELLDEWSRYHLISDALKNNLPDHIDLSLAGKIKAELPVSTSPVPQSSLIQDFFVRIRTYVSPPRLVTTSAFAATTLVAVLVGVMIGASPSTNHIENNITIAEQQAPQVFVETVEQGGVTFDVAPLVNRQVVAVEDLEQKVWEPKLNGYLNSHSAFSTSPTIHGNNVLPMIRLVDHNTSR